MTTKEFSDEPHLSNFEATIPGENDDVKQLADNSVITVATSVEKPVAEVWNFWTSPEHIVHWNNASEDWHTPFAENDLKPGGKFLSRMEAKDGSFGFDFWGVYDLVIENECIEYTLGDDRKVKINLSEMDGHTEITESFEAENVNSLDLQRNGWQAILNNFKKYCESGN